jgi:hypothetical protein
MEHAHLSRGARSYLPGNEGGRHPREEAAPQVHTIGGKRRRPEDLREPILTRVRGPRPAPSKINRKEKA